MGVDMKKFLNIYLNFAESFFNILLGIATCSNNVEDFRDDKLFYAVLRFLKSTFIFILLPLFLFLPAVAFFTSIETASVVANIYILILLACSVVKFFKSQ